MQNAIEASGLTKYYDDLLAVDHISFNVEKGEIFGFLGPNGAGKTTTIRMLVGLTTPTEGTAIVNGYDIRKKIVEVKRHVGVVPEISNLYDELTVWQNLLFMSRLYHVAKKDREKRIGSLLKTFELEDRRRSKFGNLSKGLKRRVTVAVALVHNPALVFLDEPTTGLDVMSARSLRELLNELKKTGITIFLTTHYIEEADQLCDRIAVIVKGKIVNIATPENMKSVVGTPVVEASFDSPIKSMMVRGLEAIGELRVDGCKVRIFTRDVSKVIEALTVLSKEHGPKIDYVNTVRPSLEEAFVKLTGVASEVMKAEKEGGGRGP
jgi:ABC-2 type transport system ATP-binding protein